MQQRGVAKGDRIAIMVGNRVEFVVAWFASHMVGAVVVPLNTALRGAVLKHMMDLSTPAMLISEPQFIPRVTDAIGTADYLQSIVSVGEGDVPAASTTVPFGDLQENDDCTPVDIAPWDPSAIMFTSGTTGPSKGVTYTHSYTFHIGTACVHYMDYNADDTLYTCLPLFHANALNTSLFPSLLARARIAVGNRFSVSRIWSEVIESGATATNLLGAMSVLLLRREPSAEERAHSLRTALVIPAPEEYYKLFPDRFGVEPVEAYGLTDFGMLLWKPRDEPARPGSCGVPTEGFECRIFNEFDEELPQGEVGELVARPLKPWITPAGYWEMPEATLKTYRNLWFHTGDLMYRDPDGWFYFVDREKDAMRRRGENVSSFEVEQAVLSHPEILECAAYAVPSEFTEDEIAIAVVPGPDADLRPEDLIRYVAPRLPYFAVPRYVRILEALPKTQTEKIRKMDLRADGVEDAWDREVSGLELER
jgi:crotonobetaine/carnitine-CoA ligase